MRRLAHHPPAALSLLLLLTLAARPATAQIDAETLLDGSGYGVARIHNASADIVDVAVELRHGTVSPEAVTLGDRLDALVSPASFHLAPGETQTVRILVRERLPADSVVRLVTTLTPRVGPSNDDDATAASTRLVLATRLVTRVRSR